MSLFTAACDPDPEFKGDISCDSNPTLDVVMAPSECVVLPRCLNEVLFSMFPANRWREAGSGANLASAINADARNLPGYLNIGQTPFLNVRSGLSRVQTLCASGNAPVGSTTEGWVGIVRRGPPPPPNEPVGPYVVSYRVLIAEPTDPNQVCGNWTLEAPETCDDGNATSADGCSSVCELEAGYTCPAFSPCVPICGDGLVVGAEECDPGVVGGPPCSAACTLIPDPVCGNSTLESLETCDDGNTSPGDGCSASCQIEVGYTCDPFHSCAPNCGDGLVVGTEECDPGVAGGPSCSSTCTLTVCGDWTTESPETCDDGNTDPGDGCSDVCAVEAGYACPPSATCTPICGDGLVVGSEECDPGVAGGPPCTAMCTLEFGVSIVSVTVTPPLPDGVTEHFTGVNQYMLVEVSSPGISVSLTCENSTGVCVDSFDVSATQGTPPTVEVPLWYFLAAESYRFGLVASEGGVSSPETEVLYDRSPGVGEVQCEYWNDGGADWPLPEQRRYGFRLVRPSGVAIGNADYFIYSRNTTGYGWREFSPPQLGVPSAHLAGDLNALPGGMTYYVIAVDRETTPATAEAAREFSWDQPAFGLTRGCTFCDARTPGGCQIIPLQ